MGRWPHRLAISGNEVVWDEVRQVLDDQISMATDQNQAPGLVAELRILRARFDELQATGTISEHPAVAYDRLVQEAMRRVLPEAQVTAAAVRANSVADFELRIGADVVQVETTRQPQEYTGFRARTLHRLLGSLPPGARLLVISNAVDVATGIGAVRASLADRGEVVSWRSPAVTKFCCKHSAR